MKRFKPKVRIVRKTGRPPYIPNRSDREWIIDLSGAGYTIKEMAGITGISHVTIIKYYSAEIREARPSLVAKAVNNLAVALRQKQQWATEFTLKRLGKKLGWSERLEHTGADGQSLIPEIDLSELTDAELERLIAAKQLLTRLAPELATRGGAGEASAE